MDINRNRLLKKSKVNNEAKMFSNRVLIGKFIAFAIRMATTHSPLSTDAGKVMK